MQSTQIPPLTLPSGGTVEFVDLDDLTGADVHALRKAIRQEDGAGEVTNKLFLVAMRIGIKSWNVPYLADPRTPEANEAAWKRLKARDLRAIERALDPVLALARTTGDEDEDDTPGSPPLPAGD